jgi:hypothetical protein
VALEANEAAAGPRRQCPSDLGLADTGVALEEQRPAQPKGEEDGGRQPLVGEITLRGQARGDVLDSRADLLVPHARQARTSAAAPDHRT